MESSTPVVKKNDLRRRTLMRMVEEPFKEPQVDDETERSFRRSFIESQKKSVSQSPLLNESVKFSGEQEFKEHLQLCTKLHNENKITSSVAWQLQIIDMLKVISKKQNPDTLQVASTSLDIGAKVYGIRVDDIHSDGLKLANSMARLDQKENKNKGENDNEEKEDNPKQKRSNKKKLLFKTDGPKNTLAKDIKSLIGPVPQLESVFFSSRIDSKMSTVQNLLTNRLPMDKLCSKIMIMSKENAWPSGSDKTENFLKLKEFEMNNLPQQGNICKSFENFILNQWNPDDEEKQIIENNKTLNDVVVYDDEGIPIPELDGALPDFDIVHDDNSDDDHDPIVQEELVLQQTQNKLTTINDNLFQENTQHSEYSYNPLINLNNGKVIDRIWAGPSHWKLKFIKRKQSHFTGNSEAPEVPKKKMKIAEPEVLDFSKIDEEEITNLYKNQMIKHKKKVNISQKVTLPFYDTSCTKILENIRGLMLKKGTVLMPKDQLTDLNKSRDVNLNNNNDMDAENPNTDFDDNNDNNDFVDNFNDDHGDEVCEEIITNREQQNYLGENLVDAPEYVPQAYVPYAMQAKKMDMKKLKTYTWQILTKQQSDKVIPTTFSKELSDLKEVLPPSMKNELSTQLAFSALLHCCNDYNLKLTKRSDGDFDISSD